MPSVAARSHAGMARGLAMAGLHPALPAGFGGFGAGPGEPWKWRTWTPLACAFLGPGSHASLSLS